MNRTRYLLAIFLVAASLSPAFGADTPGDMPAAQAKGAKDMEKPMFEKDSIKTSAGDLVMTFIGHGTLMFTFGGKVIHVDPWSNLADYTKLPGADVILVTHAHQDHLDPEAIKIIKKDSTVMAVAPVCADKVPGAIVMKNGDVNDIGGFKVEAVPAYNIQHKRPGDGPFHPKGEGNGYIITFGDTRVYVAGDTENTPEMKSLKNIDVAFLPMNLPYTMTPEMVTDAARAFKPKILYPYHYGKTDCSKLVELLKDSGIEVRVRRLQ